ncbi:urease accessory protein UreF [Nocardioides sp. Root190]|nr:urease accessory protein UreF [Nocardioides sp. Root190]
MLLADARLPVAGHTQSGSLEPAVVRGLGAAEVPAYLRLRLRTVVTVDAGTAVVARALVDSHGAAAGLGVLDRAWAARTSSPALRDAARGQGRALLRLTERLWPQGPGATALRAVESPPRAVVLGALACDLGLPGPALARLVGYDDVQTVCAAALKLVPLDPAVVTGWVRDALPRIEEMAESVAGLSEPDQVPATGAPQIEVWAQAHAHTTRRLFRA